MVNWDELRYLLAVRRAGSLLAAARALGVDKATVSRRIGSLETTLGVRLFDRRPDGYRLTPHGERTLAAADELDGTVAALVAELSDARGDEGGRVHLSVPQFFASEVLLPAVSRFREAHPRIELVINASSSMLNIAQREAEVGLRNVKPDQLSVTVRRVGVLGMAFYASKPYLDRRGKPTEARHLADHDLIGWASTFTQAKALLWANDFGTRVLTRVNDAAVMCDAAVSDLGIAVLPCVLGDGRPELVRLEALGTSRDPIYAVAPGELRRSGRVRAVIDLVASAWAQNERRLSGERKPATEDRPHRRPRLRPSRPR